jgi:iron(III) transport system permease protein
VVRTGEAGLSRVADILLRERTLTLVLRSLALAGTVTLLCLVVGVGLAILVTRTNIPGRRLLAVTAALPLAIPSYVAAFAWISAVPEVSGFGGTVLVLTACCYPYVYLPVAAAMRRIDPSVEEVARSLGRSPWNTFWSVTARQLRPAAASGALLVALYALSDFGAPSLLRFDAFTRVIHQSYRSSFDRTPAAVLSLLLVVITVAITVAEARTRRSGEHTRVGGGVSRRPHRVSLGRLRWPAAGVAAVVIAVALVFPMLSLLYWFTTGLSAGIDVPRLVSSTVGSVWFSVLGALLCTALAIPVGVLAARHRGRTTSFVEHASFAGHALPGIVVALALVFFGARVAQPIYQRTPLLVIAYAVLFVPAAIGAVRSAVTMSPVRTEEAARSLGSTPWEVLRRVTLPLAAPGIGAGAALVLLTCMKELPATLLLRPTGAETLATSLWTETGVAAYGAAAPYGLALVVLAVLPTLALMRSQRAGEGGVS